MSSANAISLSVPRIPPVPKSVRPEGAGWRSVQRFVYRLWAGGYPTAASLPDDLRADVAMPEQPSPRPNDAFFRQGCSRMPF